MTVGGTSLACGHGTSRPPRSLARATAGRTSCHRGSWLACGREPSRTRGRGWRRLSAAGLTAPRMETTARRRRSRSGSRAAGSCPDHRDGAALKPQPPHPSLRSSGGTAAMGVARPVASCSTTIARVVHPVRAVPRAVPLRAQDRRHCLARHPHALVLRMVQPGTGRG